MVAVDVSPRQSSLRQLDPLREPRTKPRGFQRARQAPSKELHRAGTCADPNLAGSGVEIERSLFLDFRLGIAGGEDLDAQLRCLRKTRAVAEFAQASRGGPGYVGGLHAVGCRDGAFREDASARHEICQKVTNPNLKASVRGCGRRAHDNVAMAVSFNAAFDLSQLRILKQ